MDNTDFSELLPWYANGTLDEQERRAVEAWLATSEQGRAELAVLEALAKGLKQEAAPLPSDLGWQRLKRDIRAEQSRHKRSWWQPGLAAAAAVVAVLQVAILLQPEPTPSVQLLSQGSGQVLADHWLIQVEFSDDSRWSELAGLMTSIDARVVDGPSSVGIVRLAVPKFSVSYANLSELLQYLQDQPSIVHVAVEGR